MRYKDRAQIQVLSAANAVQPKGETYMSADRGGFGWFLIGLGIGAAVGVLYAPKSGQETREELASSARELPSPFPQRRTTETNGGGKGGPRFTRTSQKGRVT